MQRTTLLRISPMIEKLDILNTIVLYFISELKKDDLDEELAMTYRDCLFQYFNDCCPTQK
jgi:hypothetical protein